MPLPTVESLSTSLDPHLVSGTLETQGLSDETYRLLQYLRLATIPNTGRDSAIHDFTKEFLRVLGYEKRHMFLRSHFSIPLLIGYGQKEAPTDLCLVHNLTSILLLVQGNDIVISHRDPEAQVIAEAIAAFRMNNRLRGDCGESELDSMTIPCITMVATQPTFYLVSVTQELSRAVAIGQYPLSPTVVKRCIVPPINSRINEGMEAPDYRQLALRHLVAFRALAETHWSAYMVPWREYCEEET